MCKRKLLHLGMRKKQGHFYGNEFWSQIPWVQIPALVLTGNFSSADLQELEQKRISSLEGWWGPKRKTFQELLGAEN